MTREEREEAIEYIKTYRELDAKLYQTAPFNTVSKNALTKCLRYWDMAIKALEQESNGDCVNRQTVKDQMIKYGFHAPDMTVTEFVEDLPSVNPQKNIVNNGTMNITL